MERSRVAAKEALEETLGRLERLVPNQTLVDERLTLNAVTPHPQVFETTFGREVSAQEGSVQTFFTTLNVITLALTLLSA